MASNAKMLLCNDVMNLFRGKEASCLLALKVLYGIQVDAILHNEATMSMRASTGVNSEWLLKEIEIVFVAWL